PMRTRFRKGPAHETSADTLCVGLFEGEGAPRALGEMLNDALRPLIESGEAKASFKKTALVHARDGGPARIVSVGLGKREEFNPERARVAAAVGYGRAKEAGGRGLCWPVPAGTEQRQMAAALTEGTLLAAYRFDRYKTGKDEKDDPPKLEELEIAGDEGLEKVVAEAALVAEAQNAARDLQN